MTDEQAVRKWLGSFVGMSKTDALQALALLDAKDAEIAAWKEHAIRNSGEADTALSRAEQAEAERDSARAVAESYRKACNDASEAGYLAAKSDFEAALAELTEQVNEANRASLSFGNQCAAAVLKARDLEAALAEERKAHQAFREELSEAVQRTVIGGQIHEALSRFILPAKPADPVKEIIAHAEKYDTTSDTDPRRRYTAAQMEIAVRAAIERAGVTISFEGEG